MARQREDGKWESRIDPGLGPSRVQVFVADTPEELFAKMENAQLNATQRINDLNGYLTPEQGERVPEFKPRQLGADEMFRLGKELQDPTTAVKAQQTLFEAMVGATAEDLRFALRSVTVNRLVKKYEEETRQWLAENPEFRRTPRNHKAMMEWLDRQESSPGQFGWPPSKRNLTLAFNALKDLPGGLPDGLHAEGEELPADGNEPGDGSGSGRIDSENGNGRIAQPGTAATRPRGPQQSGLRNSHSSEPLPRRQTAGKWTKDQVLAMKNDEYDRLYKTSQEFRKFVDSM